MDKCTSSIETQGFGRAHSSNYSLLLNFSIVLIPQNFTASLLAHTDSLRCSAKHNALAEMVRDVGAASEVLVPHLEARSLASSP